MKKFYALIVGLLFMGNAALQLTFLIISPQTPRARKKLLPKRLATPSPKSKIWRKKLILR